MEISIQALAMTLDLDYHIIYTAIKRKGIDISFMSENILAQQYVDKNEALEAIGEYLAEKVHESYELYQKWEDRAKTFDKKVIELEDEWIPVYERMPESGDRVYVRNKKGLEFPATYRKPLFYHPMLGFTIDNVTHWKNRR